MLQKVYQTYRGGCMKLFSLEGQKVYFLGTAFVVHKSGYLLTVSHILYRHDNLVVSPCDLENEFTPLTYKKISTIPVKVAQMNVPSDLALLKFKEDLDLQVPTHILGHSQDAPLGSSVACMGYPFGNQRFFNQFIKLGVVSSKVLSKKEIQFLLFDTSLSSGDKGGPLINLNDNRVIGVLNGRFHPEELFGKTEKEEKRTETNISYAVDISHAIEIMEAEGLQPI